MKQKVTKYLIALAMMLMPALAKAQAVQSTYIDAGIEVGIPPVSVTVGGSQLEFRLDGNLGGAVITGSGGQTLTGQFNIPDHVMTPLFTLYVTGDLLNLLNTISVKAGLNLATLLTGGIPVVGIETLNVNVDNGICMNAAITSVTFPETMRMIGGNALRGTGLTGNLDLSGLKQLQSIGAWTFFNCPNLTGTLSLPVNLTSIGEEAFEQTPLSGTLTIPSGVTTIAKHAFGGCRFNGNITVPASVTTIGDQAFTEMENVKSFTLSSPSLTMGINVFWNIPHLEYIDMAEATFATVPTALSREVNNAFGGVRTHTLVYLPHDATGTLTKGLAALGALNNANYVIDGVCETFRVEDGNSLFVPREFKANTAQYVMSNMVDGDGKTVLSYAAVTKRAFNKGTVSTVYLPFPFKLSDPTSLRGYALRDKKNAPVEVFRFIQQDPLVEFAANTPYLIRDLVGGSQLADATGVTVPVTPISGINYVYDYDFDIVQGAYRIGDIISSEYTGTTTAVALHPTTITDPTTNAPWGFYGTTETITNALATSLGWNAWILNSNTWYSFGSQNITPMRAFLYSTDPTATAKPSIELADLDGSTNGIASIDDNEPANSVEARIYNVNGQYLGKDINALPKGLYIVNGKKTIKK